MQGKILFVATFGDPNDPNSLKGGYRRNISLIDILLKKNNVDLMIIGKGTFDFKKKENINKNIRVIFKTYSNYINLFFKIRNFLKKEGKNYSKIIVYNPTLKTFPVVVYYLFEKNKVVIDYVDKQGTEIESSKKTSHLIQRFIEYMCLKFNDLFLTSSNALREQIKKVNKEARVLMYYGYINKDIEKERNKNNVIKFFYLGAMFDFCGIMELIESFKQVSKYNNIELYLAGQGPLRNVIKKEVKKNKKMFLMDLDSKELYPFLNKIDVCCLPYLRNYRNKFNFPSKIIDYLWAGKPILGTNVGEISKFLNFEKGGLIVKPTIEGMKEGIEQLARDTKLRTKLSQNSAKFFNKKLDPQRISSEIQSFLYEEKLE